MQKSGNSDIKPINQVNLGNVTLQPDITDGLRNLKKRRTRQAIRAAAIELFTLNGVEATTVEQIAAAADISPRTFFNYFDTKEAAVSLPYGLRNEATPPSSQVPSEATNPLAAARLAVASACFALATALENDSDERDTLLAGVRLCHREPILYDQASAQRGRWERLLLGTLPAGKSTDTLAQRAIVTAAAGAFWASLVDWAESDGDGSLVDRVQSTLLLISPR
jgi:AcrR family transcriptional regulator